MMPLVVMCGLPSSGKTKRSGELMDLLKQFKPDVDVTIVDDGNISRNDVYVDRKCEITTRSALKSEVEKLLSSVNVLIVDSLNYVKGFRYELHCISKYARSSYCVVYCTTSEEDSHVFNSKRSLKERYSSEIIKELSARFEAPSSSSRWDSPLFTVNPMDDLPGKEIVSVLFEQAALKPNMSTQNPPVMSPTFVAETDKILQSISGAILAAQKTSDVGDSIALPGVDGAYTIKEKLSVAQMRSKRKQFMSYLRANAVSDVTKIPKTFLYFLSS